MDKTMMLNMLQNYYGINKDIDFASLLGISSQVLSNWKKRNTFDVELIYTKCLNINPEWLLSGEGSMFKINSPEVIQDNTNYKELAEARLELIEMLKEKVSKLNNEVIELTSKKEYGSSVTRGAVEFLNEPQLGGISGKKG